MLMTGDEYLESLRDGRKVYIGREVVEDVTSHPAFRNAARSFAMIYDRKRAPENRDVMTFEEDGERFSTYFLLPRSREDLLRRFETHRRIASWTYGLLGRSPDNFPSYVSGLVMNPDLFEGIRKGFGDNMVNYYKHMRANDIFATHTVTNPQGVRRVGAVEPAPEESPTLRVTAEDDEGVTINGLKMLGTSAVFCHETWVGNLQPVSPGQEMETITCSVPLNAPGVSLWARKPYEKYAVSEFDNPLSYRFDETDSSVLFENVKVPWEKVVVHDNLEMTRAIYMLTPGHALANHQANVRFLEKLKLIVGLAGAIADANNAGHIPAVQTTLGQLAAMQAGLEGMIMGQIQNCEEQVPGYQTVNVRFLEKLKLIVGLAGAIADANNAGHIPAVQTTLGQLAAMQAGLEGMIMGQIQNCEEQVPGYQTVNRRYMYGALHWCTTNHSQICDMVRELMGGGPFQMPADASVLEDPELSATFDKYWSVEGQSAKERMKLLRLGWDLLGSEFAGRHMQYEKFYAGPGHVMNYYSYLNCPWDELKGLVEEIMSGYDAP